MTKDREKQLRTTQRKMLRMILGRGRRKVEGEEEAVEDWVDWIRGTAQEAEDIYARSGGRD